MAATRRPARVTNANMPQRSVVWPLVPGAAPSYKGKGLTVMGESPQAALRVKASGTVRDVTRTVPSAQFDPESHSATTGSGIDE